MFDTPTDAATFLSGALEPPAIERIVGTLVPTIVFEPMLDDHIGGTRIGGVPDMGPGAEWPRPTPPADRQALVPGGGEMDEEMVAHLDAALPFAFMAQVDLAEASALGPVASPLPDEGRLLFFYDMMTGPFETGARSARVVWDRTPVDELRPMEVPADLLRAHDERKATDLASAKEFGYEIEDDAGSSYLTEPIPREPTVKLVLPSRQSLEWEASGLDALFESDPDGDIEYAFETAFDEITPSSVDAVAPYQHRMLGTPLPEQDDPRFTAAMFELTGGEQYPDGDAYERFGAAMRENAPNWVVLFQLGVSDWMGERTEGTIYYLIRRDDLAERRFDRVIAEYQQT